MKSSRLWLIAVLIALGLAGVLAVQGIWIARAVRVSSVTMDQAVAAALENAARRVEDMDMLAGVTDTSEQKTTSFSIKKVPGLHADSLILDGRSLRPLRITRDLARTGLDTSIRQRIQVRMDSLRGEFSTIVLERDFRKGPDSILETIRLETEDAFRAAEEKLLQIELRHERLDSLLEEMVLEISTAPRPWEARIQDSTLHYILTEEFRSRGLPESFLYRVTIPGDSLRTITQSPGFPEDASDTYSVPLFRSDLLTEPALLTVSFPGRTRHLLSSMVPLLLLSLLFAMFLAFAALAGIVTMYRQKKISEVKSDLISNISHEFRTPLATISLAADAIADEKVVGDPGSVRQYIRVIKQENHRMLDQVERVLQLAMLDRRELDISLSFTEMHPLILRVTDSMRLQAESRGGTISTELTAGKQTCLIDTAHFSNALANIIDNAIKYSGPKPKVRVTSREDGNKLVLEVLDEGIGMDRATQQRIFDRFYRHSSGNVHNVKGFGLGLSYVRSVILAMEGTIEVKSAAGKGSCFTITLPLKGKDQANEKDQDLSSGG